MANTIEEHSNTPSIGSPAKSILKSYFVYVVDMAVRKNHTVQREKRPEKILKESNDCAGFPISR